MDEKKYLLSQIKKCQRKLNLALGFEKSTVFTTIGLLLAAVIEMVSLFVPLFYVHVAAAALAITSLGTGLLLALCRRRNEKAAARRLDALGLKERVSTAYEHLGDESACALLQRADAVRCLKEKETNLRIPLRPEGKKLIALFLSLVLALGLAFVPSPARETARERHVLVQQAKEKQKELAKLVKKLEQIDQKALSAEQKAKLTKLTESMKLSMEELKKSTSQTALKSASQKLDYKYEQAAGQLGALASQMKNPKDAGVTAAAEMAKAASKNKNTGASNGEGGSTQGEGQSGDSGQQQAGNGNSGNSGGSGEGTDAQGNGGNGNSNGNSNSNGNGNGGGDGSGNGSGNGNGGQKGSGRGTGSGSGTHDYVSVPNQKGSDDSLRGNKTGSENSDYYRAQNGLAWEGEHVSLDSVVGDYTKDAYEGLSSGKYPKGMEPVIKSYFKNLNE